MRVPLSWLREYVDINLPTAVLAAYCGHTTKPPVEKDTWSARPADSSNTLNAPLPGRLVDLPLPFHPDSPYTPASARWTEPPRALLDDIPACAITLSKGDPDVDHR